MIKTHVEPLVHLATDGRELYIRIAVYNGDGEMIRTFQHQRMYHRLDVPADPSRPFTLSSRWKKTKLICGIYDHTLG